MALKDLDIGEFMSDVGNAGVTMMLKIDHERTGPTARPWTVLLSGSVLGVPGAVRWDCRSIEECIHVAISKLREVADWEWLDLYSDS